MNMYHALIAAATSITIASGASGGISNFYIANSTGSIYSVNGNSLEATEVFSIQGGLAINDIIFTGNNKMLANVTDQLIEYNMSSGHERVIFDIADYYDEENEFYFTSGFAGASDGDLYFSVTSFTEDGLGHFGASVNPFSGQYEEEADLEPVSGMFFDLHELDDDLYLGADFQSSLIHLFDSDSGETLATYGASFGPVSFLELGGQIFTMSSTGELYTFDLESGDSEFFGNIDGFSGALLGAANTDIFRIPSPGSLPILGLATIVAVRRRR